MECEPLRWVAFATPWVAGRYPPDGPVSEGVYVHLADLLALLDTINPDDLRRELADLLDERSVAR